MADLSKLLDFEGGPYELSPLDVILIDNVMLPLAEMPDVSQTLKLDKKGAAGKDGAALRPPEIGRVAAAPSSDLFG